MWNSPNFSRGPNFPAASDVLTIDRNVLFRTQSDEEERNEAVQGAERKAHARREAVGAADAHVQRSEPYYREVHLQGA